MKKIGLYISAMVAVVVLTSATTEYFKISKYLELFVSVYKNLNAFYVDEVDPEELITVGIDAMLEELDPYSDFIPEEEIERFEFQSTGEYGGIGATIQKGKDYIKIISPYQGAPADKVGLRSGDLFIKIDGNSVKGKSSQDVVKLLKGVPGTSVNVTMKRGDAEFDKTITREVIKIKNVIYSGLLDDGVGYIKLSSFTTGAGKEVGDAIRSFKEQGTLKGIILDLKGNGGGLLSEAIDVTNVFVPKGQKIVTIKTRENSGDKVYSAQNMAVDTSTPLVVLIDGGSASASEIVSGTIQDLDRGVVVGRTSFGKGLVQSTRDLNYDTKLKLTTAKYLIPSGRCVQRLNYSEKDEDGHAKEVPDSLRTEFKTASGRVVYDGSGVIPDVKIESKPFPEISFSLFAKNLIYDYSLQFEKNHPSIAKPEQFVLTDDQYEKFKTFLNDKDYEYETNSEKEFKKFKEAAAEEKHNKAFDQAILALERNLKDSKKNDLDKYRKEIQFLLEREIASRYYYTAGKVANGLDDDDEVKKAIELFHNNLEYKQLLTP